MKTDHNAGETAGLYAEAYATQYSARDLAKALRLHADLIASHPDAEEAGYSRAQIQNIVREVVPIETLLASQLDLALAHLNREDEIGAPSND